MTKNIIFHSNQFWWFVISRSLLLIYCTDLHKLFLFSGWFFVLFFPFLFIFFFFLFESGHREKLQTQSIRLRCMPLLGRKSKFILIVFQLSKTFLYYFDRFVFLFFFIFILKIEKWNCFQCTICSNGWNGNSRCLIVL